MVYGDHGRKLMHPLTTMNRLAVFPFSEFYSKLLHFRIFMRTGAVLLAGYGYFAFKQGKQLYVLHYKNDIRYTLCYRSISKVTLGNFSNYCQNYQFIFIIIR